MKRPFKPGERVACYYLAARYTGKVIGQSKRKPKIIVELKTSNGLFKCHVWPQTLRRLKKKREPRVFWLNYYSDKYIWGHMSEDIATKNKSRYAPECIKVIEVIS